MIYDSSTLVNPRCLKGSLSLPFTLRLKTKRGKIPRSQHEVVTVLGRRTGQRKKVLLIAMYIPPDYSAAMNRSLYNYVNDAGIVLKSRYENPYILVAGDLNRRPLRRILKDFPEITAVKTGPTRGVQL